MEAIMQLLDEMEDYLQECNNLPFSNKVVVNMEVIHEFMADLRVKLPEEVKRSQRVLEDRDKLIEEAQMSAKAFHAEAEEEAKRLLNESRIRQQAIHEAEELMNQAKSTAREITDSAYDYVNQILNQAESVLGETQNELRQRYVKLDDYLGQQMETLKKNQAELKK